ncbi:MAG: gluconate 2-dehydrogenase subunit 3 family protein [Bacteroidetes bacterium]|nr:gluconate 2-dehydrogenase subunit 3 family protein [Bacteroidota bacterium]
MDRRDALTKLTLLIGGAVSAPTFSAFISGCAPPRSQGTYVPLSLDSNAFRLIGELAELIIPETDTPGALTAGVDRYIDSVLTDIFSEDRRSDFFLGMEDFSSRAHASYGADLREMSPEQQRDFLVALEYEAFRGIPSHVPNAASFYRQVKELTVTGYYTSEVGATMELHLMPYGKYRPIVPLEEIGRAWA